MKRFLVAGLLVLASVGGCSPVDTAVASGQSDAELIPLTIHTSKAVQKFRVELARSPAEQAQGLMYRTELPADGGMIFPFPSPRPAAFWMKNTLIPLDMLFIRADGTIARIARETVPHSLEPVESGEPVVAVFEIAGGRADALGISEGDRVIWPGGPTAD